MFTLLSVDIAWLKGITSVLSVDIAVLSGLPAGTRLYYNIHHISSSPVLLSKIMVTSNTFNEKWLYFQVKMVDKPSITLSTIAMQKEIMFA